MPGGMSKRAKVGCRLSRFAAKQMYIHILSKTHVTDSNFGAAGSFAVGDRLSFIFGGVCCDIDVYDQS